MTLSENLKTIQDRLAGTPARLVAVSKMQPVSTLQDLYALGCRTFGENRVQELLEKVAQLPPDIEWHLIGHLQTNKVKYIAPFVAMIQSVDSLKLLREIDKQARRNGRVIECLLQLFIAREETKFGLTEAEAEALLQDPELPSLTGVRIVGLMGLATNTDDTEQVRREFRTLRGAFDRFARTYAGPHLDWREVSMGMSGDYPLALAEGSTLVRVGSALFGPRG
jgi:pyridoxal phosphate enzyme (YggS family)